MPNTNTLRVNPKNLFVRTHYKLKSSLRNNGNSLLGTDVLRENKKRLLFRIVTLNIEQQFLKLSNNKALVFNDKILLLKIVKDSIKDFLISSYGLNLNINQKILNRSLYLEIMLKDSDINTQLLFRSLINKDLTIFRDIFEPIYRFP